MNNQRQNNIKLHNPSKSKLDIDWEDTKRQLTRLLYLPEMPQYIVLRHEAAKLLSAMNKNQPTKKLLRSIQSATDKLNAAYSKMAQQQRQNSR